MPLQEAPNVELGSAPRTPSLVASPSPSEISSTSSPEPHSVRATPLFRALAMPPPEPEQPPGQEELERRLPGYRRIVIPRELTLIELLKQCSGVTSDEEVLTIREAKLRVVAERVGLRRLHVLVPLLRSLNLDGSALLSLRELGIGLVHLKMLSINRCGLTSLDGVWGLVSLRELHASGNRIRDLQPLAVLQKLHTLDLSNNPISESSRIWTLGVCGALRRLFLQGAPLSEASGYRSVVASTLPMLVTLDERPIHAETGTDDYIAGDTSDSGSDSASEQECDARLQKNSSIPTERPIAGQPSQAFQELQETSSSAVVQPFARASFLRRRPATTENGGIRPSKATVPRRPRTAADRPTIDAPTRLQIMNTLMDAEWRCSGSELTSKGAVCGNLARALRRPALPAPTGAEKQIECAVEEACRTVAEEIPRAPCQEDWVRFREETGIDIDINFNERPRSMDPSEALDRLERIEQETSERLKMASRGKHFNTYNARGVCFNDNLFYRENGTSSIGFNGQSNVESLLTDTGDINFLDPTFEGSFI